MRFIGREVLPLVVVAVAVTLVACADVSSRPPVERTAELPPDKGLILFKADHVGDRPARRIQYSDNEQRVEYALYRGGGAQAEFVYMERPYNLNVAFNFPYTIADRVGAWNYSKDQPIQWEQATRIDTKLGDVFYRPYRLTARNQHCFGVSGEWDRDPKDWRQRHTRIMFGYYCAPAGQELSRDRMMSLIGGLGLKGVTDRSDDYADTVYNFHRDVAANFSGPQGSLKATGIARNGAGDSAGVADYPFHLAEYYNPYYGRGGN
ncbi:MAG: hypothetical protein HYW28_09595 [Rhodospirillales bacterium]|nr:hypothetical protein [Rhodospirillales bacterium]